MEIYMSIKEDARVKKTKEKLLSTFKEILTRKSFEDITVNEICDMSNVRRATFYKHFADKYAFLKYLVGSLRDDFDSTLPKRKKPDATSDYYIQYLKALVNFLDKNELMVKNALESEVLPSLINVIAEKNYEDTCDRLKLSVNNGMLLPASVEITASMMIGAVSNTLLRWFNNGKNTPIDTLVNEISSVISAMQNAKCSNNNI